MRTIIVCLLLVLGSGCLESSEPTTVPAPEFEEGGNATVEDNAPEVVTGVGNIAASGGGAAASTGGGEITIKEGATILFVEWAWDDPVIDLDGALSSPSAGTTQGVQNIDHTAEGGSPGNPDSPHSLTLTGPELGLWTISMSANGGAADTDYRFAATAFYGEGSVPEGYTAL